MFLDKPLSDPIRSRMAISNAEYGCSIQRFKRAARRIPEGITNALGCVAIGAVLGLLMGWGGR